jgi:FAD:protein FMN transferase
MTRCQPALGTYVEIKAHTEGLVDVEAANAALAHATDQAFAAIAEAQSCMSVFDPDSDLTHLNAGKFLDKPGRIHPWLWEVLSLAKEVHHLSSAFDPCIGLSLVRRGMRPDHGLTHPQTRSTLKDVLLLEDYCVVTTQPVYLDLGGIAKGEAVDRAVQALQTHGVKSGCVNAGGDLRVFGQQAQSIFLRHPSSPQNTTYIGELQDGAIASSGDYFAADATTSSSSTGHLIDPQDATCISTQHSYSVIASRCAVADALTKVFAITGDVNHPALRHFDAQPILLPQ